MGDSWKPANSLLQDNDSGALVTRSSTVTEGESSAAVRHVLPRPDDNKGAYLLDVTVMHTNGSALSSFIVRYRTTENAPFRVVASAGSDYTSPSKRMIAASGDLTSLAAHTPGGFTLAAGAINAVEIVASDEVSVFYSWQS